LIDIAAFGAPARVGAEHHFQQQITRAGIAQPWAAASCQADVLTSEYAFWDLDLQVALRHGCVLAVHAGGCAAKHDFTLSAGVAVGDVQLDPGVMVGAPLGAGRATEH